MESTEEKIARLESEVETFRTAGKEISDAYLRVRELVGAWNTNHGGENRYQVTEDAIKALRAEVERHGQALLDKVIEINEWKKRAEQAESALRELYTYPGVRDLLAPNDSLGSIAQRVEDILK